MRLKGKLRNLEIRTIMLYGIYYECNKSFKKKGRMMGNLGKKAI
ncbi:hypothetical protein [Borrelia miyamotoi]|nr:hypothetical protein [Borrelia miyamotoi]WCB91012.1 hypothetical protein CNO11_07145 [Borrelia miyamotoi]WEG99531.1 hypothetical protein EZU69_07065 [Borrelia miyamotoi]